MRTRAVCSCIVFLVAAEYNWGFALVIGAMQISSARILVSIVATGCEPYIYTQGPGVQRVAAEQAAAAAAVDSAVVAAAPTAQSLLSAAGIHRINEIDLTLFERLTQYQQMLDLFTWEHMLAVAISLTIMCLAKFSYQAAGRIALGSSFELTNQISTQQNRALAISFSGYLLAVGNILSGLFSGNTRQRIGWELDTSDANTPSTLSFGEQLEVDLLWALFGMLALLLVQLISDFVIFRR